MIFAETIINAQFIERPNRYLAIVNIDGKEVEAFVPNPGRMKELLIPGVEVGIRPAKKTEKRKTLFDLITVYYANQWVCIDSQVPNKFMYHLLTEGKLKEFKAFTEIKKEVKYKKSRFDFFIKNDKREAYLETKSCTLVEEGAALFPDAPTERGTRHLMELVESIEEGYEAFATIVIQRNDATVFRPNRKTDPKFADAFSYALDKGVQIYAYTSTINKGEILFHKKIEVERA